jgi:hypothetical protein
MALVTDKELIPSKFGLGDKPVSLSALKSTIVSKLNNKPPAVKTFCLYLLENSLKGSSSISKPAIRLSDKEINIILKDFGELTGAAYVLTVCKLYKSVKFPTGNEKLIDYIMVRKDGLEEKFSAKAGQGGKPSITSLMPAINAMEKEPSLSPKMKKAIKVIKLISTEEKNGLYLGPLKAAQFLKTPGYEALIKLLKNAKIYTGNDVPSSDQLQAAVDYAGNFKNVMEMCEEFFEKSGYSSNINETVTKRLIETPKIGKEKVWGVLHYPITAELIKWLNDDKNGAKEVLTAAATTLTVNQIYLDTDSRGYKYAVKSFSKGTFQFGSPSSMPRPTNNRIGFTMVKSKDTKSGLPDH